MNVLRNYCSSFHKLTVKYCCKYFARDPLDFGKVNWQVLPPTHTSLPLLTNQLALQNQKHNTQTHRQTYISTHRCLLVQMKMVIRLSNDTQSQVECSASAGWSSDDREPFQRGINWFTMPITSRADDSRFNQAHLLNC